MEELVGQTHKRLLASLGPAALDAVNLRWEFGECGQVEIVGNPYVLVHGLCMALKEAIRCTVDEDKSIVLSLEQMEDRGVMCRIVYSPDVTESDLDQLNNIKLDPAASSLGTARAVLSDRGKNCAGLSRPVRRILFRATLLVVSYSET